MNDVSTTETTIRLIIQWRTSSYYVKGVIKWSMKCGTISRKCNDYPEREYTQVGGSGRYHFVVKI